MPNSGLGGSVVGEQAVFVDRGEIVAVPGTNRGPRPLCVQREPKCGPLIDEAAAGKAAAKPTRSGRPVPDVPEDFAAALAKARRAKSHFDGFPPSQKREYIEWITDAKREDTRSRRIAQAVEWLAEGKRRNWKYENC